VLIVDRRVRVLSIPAEHPYPQAIKPSNADYLEDPDIDGNWWPHPALEAEYWDQFSAKDIPADLVHVHFGFEHRTPQQIQEFVDALPVPLVLTVHDLENPHLTTFAEQQEHHERLRILIRAAEAVTTLTDLAADRLRQELGATSVTVMPHPAITRTRPESPRDPVPAVFLKSLRNNVISDPQFYLDVAAATGLRVYLHSDAATDSLRTALNGKVDLRVHKPFSDAELHREVASGTTCLLPYVRGTHSGWLEMCRDMGTTVVAPDVGCYFGQADCPEAVETYRAGDAQSAIAALQRQVKRGSIPYQGDRDRQLAQIHDFQANLYNRLQDITLKEKRSTA